jgi:hypothetical protein
MEVVFIFIIQYVDNGQAFTLELLTYNTLYMFKLVNTVRDSFFRAINKYLTTLCGRVMSGYISFIFGSFLTRR